ncbi:MAG: DinB family protein [Gemmatimonadota bacterium]
MTNRSAATTRRTLHLLAAAALVTALSALPAAAQTPGARAQSAPQTAKAVADELLRQFEASMSKFIALANAMPAEKYTWSPGEGVMEVGHVFMHVAHYNYAYPDGSMGVAAPAGLDMDAMEAVRAKADVVRALEQSRSHVLDAVRAMTAAELAGPTQLYGRDIERWAVLVQLVAHMNEHLGQSIAYARMNDIVPPWSR